MNRCKFLVLLEMLSLCMVMHVSVKVVAINEIPYLEDEEISCEEQNVLDVLQVNQPPSFWQWLYVVKNIFVERCATIKRGMQKNYDYLKKWWHEHVVPEKKKENYST